MGVRELLADHKKPAMIGAIVLVVLAGGYAIRTGVAHAPVAKAGAFYAVDDGSKPFEDTPGKLPPFDHHGKQAYLAAVYSGDEGKTKFIGYLQRLTATAKTRIETGLKDPKVGEKYAMYGITDVDLEVKKPGAGGTWVSRADPAAVKIVDVRGPNGEPAELVSP